MVNLTVYAKSAKTLQILVKRILLNDKGDNLNKRLIIVSIIFFSIPLILEAAKPKFEKKIPLPEIEIKKNRNAFITNPEIATWARRNLSEKILGESDYHKLLTCIKAETTNYSTTENFISDAVVDNNQLESKKIIEYINEIIDAEQATNKMCNLSPKQKALVIAAGKFIESEFPYKRYIRQFHAKFEKMYLDPETDWYDWFKANSNIVLNRYNYWKNSILLSLIEKNSLNNTRATL